MDSATVSVVIATYNRADYIAECLHSILQQSIPPHEVIVVDDGSDDDTPERVAQFRHRVRYIRKANGGRASAFNAALPLITGDWVWFFDDDDIALPNSIELRLRALAAAPDVDLVASGQFVGRSDLSGRLAIAARVDLTLRADDALMLNVLKAYAFRLQGMLIRTRCFDVVGPFDERYLRSQDYEMIVRLLRRFKAAILPEPTFIWRDHPGVRGPAHTRHSGADRVKVWMEYDGMLGRQVRATFKLGEFLVPRVDDDTLSPAAQRLALLNRMAVMASKTLVEEAFEDVDAAAAISEPDAPPDLTREEREICVRAVLHPYFIERALGSPSAIIRRLRRQPHTRLKRSIAGCFARGLLYAALHHDLGRKERLRLASLSARIAATAGASSMVAAYVSR